MSMVMIDVAVGNVDADINDRDVNFGADDADDSYRLLFSFSRTIFRVADDGTKAGADGGHTRGVATLIYMHTH